MRKEPAIIMDESRGYRLYARPTYLQGMARTLDLGGSVQRVIYNMSSTPNVADTRALASDWRAVGSDLAVAMQQVECSHGKNES